MQGSQSDQSVAHTAVFEAVVIRHVVNQAVQKQRAPHCGGLWVIHFQHHTRTHEYAAVQCRVAQLVLEVLRCTTKSILFQATGAPSRTSTTPYHTIRGRWCTHRAVAAVQPSEKLGHADYSYRTGHLPRCVTHTACGEQALRHHTMSQPSLSACVPVCLSACKRVSVF